jgi:hypothetical protein
VDELGACCVDDACYEVTSSDCEERGGYFYGVSVDCTDSMVECEPAVDELGACCMDGYCYEVSIADCHAGAGYWYGAGTDCSDPIVECPEPPPEAGACCVDGACYDLTDEECADRDGTWYGLGVPCSDPSVDCDEDTGEPGGDDTGDDEEIGACCIDGACFEITATKCWNGQGAYYGPGSDCDDTFVECCSDDDDGGSTDPVDDAEPCKGGGCSTGGGIGDMAPVGLVALLALIGTSGRRRKQA